MQKGDRIYPKSDLSKEVLDFWELEQGSIHIVKKVYFENGEHQVDTDKGSWPLVFFNNLNEEEED